MIENKVAEIRKKAGLTQLELSYLVGVTRRTIISLEKGNYTPSLLLALNIAKALDVDVNKIFTLKDE
ncbi:helix-turn-helix transcriptional regulator [Staphylococcus delphini]|uniref:helix-turn-helix transcriptional regulator n=1 Tax=Staphylococcus delphini TaxID=53344 RepID=UPI0023B2D965|nr:helix-turn-helix transcriptional regulator [Staphylococcus delphini]MDE9751607.1 helix-turn-helix transcriptional regulator [Staphylococcus delphini]MDE9788885.1 helix-turn-helix transcriptional regulator [Staphylococcus delphini]MDE9791481.1 helix-turn-helix transcriptional regulator [Staphylococcus delphini]MDE9793812.1 helix-turn-helix transcriptional regulator [Staphylococcus delphini]MDE9797933.1 helix-turn-helix transcriptional regulator [Staphylococcus delphini]